MVATVTVPCLEPSGNHFGSSVMAYLHCRTWVQTQQTRIRIPNPMATLYYAEHVHIARIRTWIPTPYFCTGQESEFESVPESLSDHYGLFTLLDTDFDPDPGIDICPQECIPVGCVLPAD